MPCSPNDITINTSDVPSGPPIPGFGIPFALKVPDISPFPDGFPEDLMDILNKLQFIIPPGTLKPALNPNFGKDVFDGIMKLLDQFMPFLMLYKFFLPVLNLIVCIIEVLCAIPNPYKLVRAIRRLFRNCLPPFLSLFPIFALIIMIISILLLMIALVEYIIQQLLKLIKAMLRNILALNKAISENNSTSVLAIAKKLGSLLCMFQNLFVLLSLFSIIIDVIKNILKVAFSIPPCNSNSDCCGTDVCPSIVKQNYTRVTGTFKYLNAVKQSSSFGSPFTVGLRDESWQLFDSNQEIAQKFINIVDGYDITVSPKPVFFPTDATYNASTPTNQAPYLIDMRMYYNPSSWGRIGAPRWIRFKDCIVTNAPTNYYFDYQNAAIGMSSGTLKIVGGLGYEDNGSTPLIGFLSDGTTSSGKQATVQNFFHYQDNVGIAPTLLSTDGYQFSNVEYTFKPMIEVLINKNLVTLGCHPDLAADKAAVNELFAGDASLKFQMLSDLINSDAFPNPNATLECLNTAVSALRNNLTVSGLATFQTMATVCLEKLKSDASLSLSSAIDLGFDPCNSLLSGSPKIQFTSQPIQIKVDLRDRNGISLGMGLPSDVGSNIANKMRGYPTFGTLSNFKYDGYQYFTADLNSLETGSGELTVSYDDNILCTNIAPADLSLPVTHSLQKFEYKFIYTLGNITSVTTSIGNESDGPAQRRDASDLIGEYSGNNGSGGSE